MAMIDSNFDDFKDGSYVNSYEFFEKTPLNNGNTKLSTS